MNGATDCCIFQSTALFEFAMHYTKKTTINKQILCRFQENFFRGSEKWNSPSFFRCFAPCPAFLWADKLSHARSFYLPRTYKRWSDGIFSRRPWFLKVLSHSSQSSMGKDTSKRRIEPGSDLPSRFSAWAPFCKCGWRHHISRSGCGPDWWNEFKNWEIFARSREMSLFEGKAH